MQFTMYISPVINVTPTHSLCYHPEHDHSTQWWYNFQGSCRVCWGYCTLVTFCMSCRRRETYIGHARLCVCLSTAACPHYCMDLDVTWRNGRGCPLVVHYWVDLQSVQGFRCYDNIMQSVRGFHCNDSTAANAKCQRVLVLALCLVFRNWPLFNPAKMVTVLYGTKAQHEKTARTVVLFCNNVKLLGTALGSNNRLACHWSSTYLQL